jgi:hypothetical protein
MFMTPHGGEPGWRATADLPFPLMQALFVRDAALLKPGPGTDPDTVIPQLDPLVPPDDRLVRLVTEATSGRWCAWWESLLERHPEFAGLPPLLPERLAELPADLYELIRLVSGEAHAYCEARKRELILDPVGRGGRLTPPLGPVVDRVARELGHACAPFDLLISVLPVCGIWGRRVTRSHLLISRQMAQHPPEFEVFLAPVVRDLAE